MPRKPPASPKHVWAFRARFRRGAFGWRSRPAVTRVQEAVREIKKVARKDPALAAEGAVLFLERVSPALEHVDGSSGAIGTAVNRAVEALSPIIAEAPVERAVREAWLERLFEAHAADTMPYIDQLAEHWGELCASPEVASAWADNLLGITRLALSPDPDRRGFFHGTSACLSALHAAERYDEIVDLVADQPHWHYRRWAVAALLALGRKADGLRLAESSRGPWTPDSEVDRLGEQILLDSGLVEEAYRRYGLHAHRKGTYLATFREVARRYPDKDAATLLADLAGTTPGEEGKWFAAAKEAGLWGEAIALAGTSPTDPKTLTRAARDTLASRPEFAVEAGLLALTWIARGHGYEITSIDVHHAYAHTLLAADACGVVEETDRRIEALMEAEPDEFFVRALKAVRSLRGRPSNT